MYGTRLFNCVVVFALVLALSCASKKEKDQHHVDVNESVWKEMDDFHIIMADTFHPYKDSSNLEPARRRAYELMTAANRWAAADLPEKVDNQAIRSKLEQLKSETAALAEHAKSADENAIAVQLARVHDTFHEIQEAWYGRH